MNHLTSAQKNIWNLQKYYENTTISTICGAIVYGKVISSDTLQKALNLFLQEQESLRLRFQVVNGEPYQYAVPYEEELFPVVSFPSEQEYREFVETEKNRAFTLVEGKLYRFFICQFLDHTALFLVVNHLIMDAWSMGILGSRVAELVRMYEADGEDRETTVLGNSETEGKQKACQPQAYSYMEHIEREKAYRQSGHYQADQEYWKGLYAKKPQVSYVKPEREANTGVIAKRFARSMEKGFSKDILEFCSKEQITPALLFEAALCIYLGKLNPEKETVNIGMMALNRTGKKEKKTAGMFVSTIPLSVPYGEQMTVRDLFGQVLESQGGSFRHQQYPYADIQGYLKSRHQMSGNLYDVLFSYQNTKIQSKLPFHTEWYCNGYSEVALALHVDDRDGTGMFRITMDYQTDVFPQAEEIGLLYERFVFIIRQMMEVPTGKLEGISILPQAERHRLVELFNDTYVDYPKDKSNREKCPDLMELFQEQVKRFPQKPALIYEDKVITYEELDKISDNVAGLLNGQGIERDEIVPVVAVRGWQVVAAMLGIVKAGGAYLLVDAKYPQDRILYLLKESGAGICLTLGWNFEHEFKSQDFPKNGQVSGNRNENHGKQNGAWKIFALEQMEFWQSVNSPVINVQGESGDAFCALHTSGTTGRPKILLLSHGNIAHFTKVLRGLQEGTEEVLSGTQIGFDAFTLETVMSLANGKIVRMLSGQEMTKQAEFETCVEKCGRAFMFQTPSKLMGYIRNSKGKGFLRHVGVWLLGGETFPPKLYTEIKKWNPESVVINGYGPSETTQGCLCKNIKDNNEITLGRPFPHIQIYILDKNQSMVPAGVPGELCIAGDGVGLGYLNQPELTAEKFVPNPFATAENGHGKVMYKSGDLARWNSDGEVEFLGRMDTQVKVRGLRIELGEIESVMLQFPGILMSAAAAKKDVHGRQYLVGYYCTQNRLDERKLREYLLSKLPKYMVPNYFVHLEQMPLMPSGKLDRNSLPEPVQLEDGIDFQDRDAYAAPENELQERLCGLVAGVLHVGQVGIDDDFFELGGDSLTALELVAKAEDQEIGLELQWVFNYPTVRQMEGHLSRQEAHGSISNTENQEIEERLRARYGTADLRKVSAEMELAYYSLGTVLLTGATGFLGMHLLYHLLKSETGRVYCLLRDKESERRFWEGLEYYFGTGCRQTVENRISFVYGELSNQELAGRLKSQMEEPVQTVIHAAAIVKHYGKEELFYEINVEGTRQMLEFAALEGAAFVHISTVSVGGMRIEKGRSREPAIFDENCLYIGQSLDNVYIRSKYEAELCVMDAIGRGQEAKICRVGNLTNRRSDGKFQKNASENAFLKRMRAFLELEAYPQALESQPVEFSPVDETAETIILLAQHTAGMDCSVFHVNHTSPPTMEELAAMCRECGNELKAVDTEKFLERLYQLPGREYDAVKNEFREYFRQGFGQEGKDGQTVQIQNEFTGKLLDRLKFQWREIDVEYVDSYIRHIGK